MIVGLVLFIFFTQSCKKDNIVIEPVYDPTPYNLNVPGFVTSYMGNMPIPSDNPLTEQGVKLGRMLFYEKLLSDDKSMSCASCHLQSNSFNDPNQFSQGTNGAFGERNAMSIVNSGWMTSMFWDGRRNTMEEQAHDPVTNQIEMRNDWNTVVSRLQAHHMYPSMFFQAFGTEKIDSNLVTKAIAQFERTLISFNSPFDTYFYGGDTTILNSSQKRGFDLFFGQAECIHCHSGPLLTDNMLRNNGLNVVLTDLGRGSVTGNPLDNGKFKVPTLRNIAFSAPYMHDGRFSTLEQVVEFYNSGVQGSSPNLDSEMAIYVGGLNLTAQNKIDLVNFLKTFTDQQFLNNTKFSDPH